MFLSSWQSGMWGPISTILSCSHVGQEKLHVSDDSECPQWFLCLLKPSLLLQKSHSRFTRREKWPAPLRQLRPQMPSYCDKDLKGANEIISFAFYSSVTTTKLDEMAPCSSNLRPILLPSTLILSFKRIWDPEDPQANRISNCRLLPPGQFPRGRFSFPRVGSQSVQSSCFRDIPFEQDQMFPRPCLVLCSREQQLLLPRSMNVISAREAKAKGRGHLLIVYQTKTRPTQSSTLGGLVAPIKR